jgi:hypothetical protein
VPHPPLRHGGEHPGERGQRAGGALRRRLGARVGACRRADLGRCRRIEHELTQDFDERGHLRSAERDLPTGAVGKLEELPERAHQHRLPERHRLQQRERGLPRRREAQADDRVAGRESAPVVLIAGPSGQDHAIGDAERLRALRETDDGIHLADDEQVNAGELSSKRRERLEHAVDPLQRRREPERGDHERVRGDAVAPAELDAAGRPDLRHGARQPDPQDRQVAPLRTHGSAGPFAVYDQRDRALQHLTAHRQIEVAEGAAEVRRHGARERPPLLPVHAPELSRVVPRAAGREIVFEMEVM